MEYKERFFFVKNLTPDDIAECVWLVRGANMETVELNKRNREAARGDYKIVSEFMHMRDPGSGWKGRQHAWDKIHAVSAKMNTLMFKTWITVRKEWLEWHHG